MKEALRVGDMVRVVGNKGKLSKRLYEVDCIIPAINSIYIRAVGRYATHEYALEDVVILNVQHIDAVA